MKKLFADLDSAEFAAREKAGETLSQLGEAARSALQAELAHAPSPEVRKRPQGLVDRLAAPTPARLRLIRAVEAVEGAGAPEAKALLEAWAGGAWGNTLATEAKAALARRRR
jgi:hypothetical protein